MEHNFFSSKNNRTDVYTTVMYAMYTYTLTRNSIVSSHVVHVIKLHERIPIYTNEYSVIKFLFTTKKKAHRLFHMKKIPMVQHSLSIRSTNKRRQRMSND